MPLGGPSGRFRGRHPYAVTRSLTILRSPPSPAADPAALALAALGWILADDDRAERLLSLTGLTPDALRQGLADPGVLGAVLDYLAGHEPDLIAAADAIGTTPEALAGAGERLAR